MGFHRSNRESFGYNSHDAGPVDESLNDSRATLGSCQNSIMTYRDTLKVQMYLCGFRTLNMNRLYLGSACISAIKQVNPEAVTCDRAAKKFTSIRYKLNYTEALVGNGGLASHRRRYFCSLSVMTTSVLHCTFILPNLTLWFDIRLSPRHMNNSISLVCWTQWCDLLIF